VSTDESSRVYLQPIRGIEGSDYINASFIDVRHSIITTVTVNVIEILEVF